MIRGSTEVSMVPIVIQAGGIIDGSVNRPVCAKQQYQRSKDCEYDEVILLTLHFISLVLSALHEALKPRLYCVERRTILQK